MVWPYGKYDKYEEVGRIYERKYGNSGDLGVIHREWENVDVNHKDIQNLKNYLRSGIWRWYFEYVQGHNSY